MLILGFGWSWEELLHQVVDGPGDLVTILFLSSSFADKISYSRVSKRVAAGGFWVKLSGFGILLNPF